MAYFYMIGVSEPNKVDREKQAKVISSAVN